MITTNASNKTNWLNKYNVSMRQPIFNPATCFYSACMLLRLTCIITTVHYCVYVIENGFKTILDDILQSNVINYLNVIDGFKK